jgi:exodeoxyribonuclease VII large subunit
VDVIILARGGGSLEELWCFNDEAVVRAVAVSRIPIVAGVGHEIDFTLVDFAADVRAPTPSAAAEVVTPDGLALQAAVSQRVSRMTSAMRYRLESAREDLFTQARLLERLSPAHRVQTARQRLDDFLARGAASLRHDLRRRRERVAAQARALDAANPHNLLRRGYALITDAESGQRVTSAAQAPEGAALEIALHDGRLTAQVRGRRFIPGKTG